MLEGLDSSLGHLQEWRGPGARKAGKGGEMAAHLTRAPEGKHCCLAMP